MCAVMYPGVRRLMCIDRLYELSVLSALGAGTEVFRSIPITQSANRELKEETERQSDRATAEGWRNHWRQKNRGNRASGEPSFRRTELQENGTFSQSWRTRKTSALKQSVKTSNLLHWSVQGDHLVLFNIYFSISLLNIIYTVKWSLAATTCLHNVFLCPSVGGCCPEVKGQTDR